MTKKEIIEKIKELREQGKLLREIAKELSISITLVRYYLDEKVMEKQKELSRKRYKELSKEEKKKLYQEKKEYYNNYYKRRYREDEDFREKQKKRAMENYKKVRKQS